MAVPKRKTSKMRKRTRRSHNALHNEALPGCPRCGHPRKPHTICGHCGHYKGKDVLKLEEV